jgi:hypothetical protein
MTSRNDDNEDNENNHVAFTDNSYLALRDAKIKRNEARLRELGFMVEKPKQRSSSRTTKSARARVPTQPLFNTTPVASQGTVRRSQRLSKLTTGPVDYNGVVSDRRIRRSPRHPVVGVTTPSSDAQRTTRRGPKANAVTAPAPPPAVNSVRSISIGAQRLVLGVVGNISNVANGVTTSGLLGLTLEQTGKEYAIIRSFEAAASSSDQELLVGAHLSFNKYSGVQQWHDCIFLWVNLGTKDKAIANEFLDGGTKITWFGGSRMVDDTPVVEKLIRWGKEATDSSSKIILWCRLFDPIRKTFHPYVCLGRLSYDSHQPQSYPLAFVWSLLDAERMRKNFNSAVRDNFQKMIHS